MEQGIAQGGARFRRLEGCWWGDSKGYFLSTNGGPVSEGQVFEYDPFNETIKLIYASPTANDLDNPDNMTVTPRGGLLLCEDAAGGANVVGERLVGLTLDGQTFTFAQNNVVLTQGRSRPRARPSRRTTTAPRNLPAPATARTASGCSSTSRRRALPSRSPARGATGRSESSLVSRGCGNGSVSGNPAIQLERHHEPLQGDPL